MKYKDIIYMCLDELKSVSDDSFYTEEHIIFLAEKYRSFILKKTYADVRKPIPESNYQTLCLNLMQVPAIAGMPCEGGTYLRSTAKVPFMLKIVQPLVYPTDYFTGDITYVSRDRMRYVGNNKYLSNIIYTTVGPDNYLYLKSKNPQFLYLEKVRLTGIFEKPQEALESKCDDDDSPTCDVFDADFPLEEALIPVLVESIVKELSGFIYRPKDNLNNANDDFGKQQPQQKSEKSE